MRTVIPDKLQGERVVVTFIFNKNIVISNPEVTTFDQNGTESTVQMVIGTPQIQGNKILQLIGNGVAGNTYELRCQVDIPATNERYIAKGNMRVI